MDNVIQFQTRKEKTREEIYAEMAREGEAITNIQIIEVSPEESRLYQEAYEAEFQMQGRYDASSHWQTPLVSTAASVVSLGLERMVLM